MEKNTKILIGVGAIIAAYLILKPKKAMANTQNKNVVTENGYQFIKDSQEEKSFYSATFEKYQIGGRPKDNDIIFTPFGQYKFTLTKQGVAPAFFNEGYWTKIKSFDPNCVCAQAPCNCGDGGVKLDTLIQNQSYEY
jgi:hypothetical protein